jgi:hypothetical protein
VTFDDDHFGIFEEIRAEAFSARSVARREAHNVLMGLLDATPELYVDLKQRLRAAVASTGGWWGLDPQDPCVLALHAFLDANTKRLGQLNLPELDPADVVATMRDRLLRRST